MLRLANETVADEDTPRLPSTLRICAVKNSNHDLEMDGDWNVIANDVAVGGCIGALTMNCIVSSSEDFGWKLVRWFLASFYRCRCICSSF